MSDFFESLDHAFVDVFLFSRCINVAFSFLWISFCCVFFMLNICFVVFLLFMLFSSEIFDERSSELRSCKSIDNLSFRSRLTAFVLFVFCFLFVSIRIVQKTLMFNDCSEDLYKLEIFKNKKSTSFCKSFWMMRALFSKDFFVLDARTLLKKDSSWKTKNELMIRRWDSNDSNDDCLFYSDYLRFRYLQTKYSEKRKMRNNLETKEARRKKLKVDSHRK